MIRLNELSHADLEYGEVWPRGHYGPSRTVTVYARTEGPDQRLTTVRARRTRKHATPFVLMLPVESAAEWALFTSPDVEATVFLVTRYVSMSYCGITRYDLNHSEVKSYHETWDTSDEPITVIDPDETDNLFLQNPSEHFGYSRERHYPGEPSIPHDPRWQDWTLLYLGKQLAEYLGE